MKYSLYCVYVRRKKHPTFSRNESFTLEEKKLRAVARGEEWPWNMVSKENVSIRKKIKAVDLCTWVNWTEWMVRFEMLSLTPSLSMNRATMRAKSGRESEREREGEWAVTKAYVPNEKASICWQDNTEAVVVPHVLITVMLETHCQPQFIDSLCVCRMNMCCHSCVARTSLVRIIAFLCVHGWFCVPFNCTPNTHAHAHAEFIHLGEKYDSFLWFCVCVCFFHSTCTRYNVFFCFILRLLFGNFCSMSFQHERTRESEFPFFPLIWAESIVPCVQRFLRSAHYAILLWFLDSRFSPSLSLTPRLRSHYYYHSVIVHGVPNPMCFFFLFVCCLRPVVVVVVDVMLPFIHSFAIPPLFVLCAVSSPSFHFRHRAFWLVQNCYCFGYYWRLLCAKIQQCKRCAEAIWAPFFATVIIIIFLQRCLLALNFPPRMHSC